MFNLALGTPSSDEGRSRIVTDPNKLGHAVFGPYEFLHPGSYIVEFHIELAQNTSLNGDARCAILDVSRNFGNEILVAQDIQTSELQNGRTKFAVAFEIAEPSRMEYRVFVSGEAPLIIDEYRRVIRLDGTAQEAIMQHDFPANDTGNAFFREHKAYFRSLYENNFGVRLEGDAVVLSKDGMSFFARSRDDLTFIGEILFENTYNILSSRDTCLIDIGMNIGLATLSFASKPEVKEVHSFEPFPETFERARKNLGLNPALMAKIHAYNIGISDRNWSGEILAATTSDSGARSTLSVAGGRPTFMELRDAGDTLRPIIESARANGRSVVLKVDCEGSEFAIFESLDRAGLFDKIDGFMVEWHAMFPDKDQHNLLKPLRDNRFVIFDRSPARGNGFFYAARLAS
ncbi:FkbM family methyltransferase [Sphingomonas sp. PR090111-T3T-6A]|uniref:FkbM family methyltransferase n=1 Tax=Sphingomonas sp. PR090111-T3T-6A TaxID=685778 RepID=UPI0003700E16|nr:FkbM family methyltransferase [Sphingomonas sp. PR090111-T3T-6A]